MSPAADVKSEVTQDEVLAEFARVMHEWSCTPFVFPLSPAVCGGVKLPGPDELAVRADEFEARVTYARSARA